MNETLNLEREVAPVRKEIVDVILQRAIRQNKTMSMSSRSNLNKGLVNSLRYKISNLETELKEI